MKNMEEKIWDDISGQSSPEAQEELKNLLASNPAYQELYQEIRSLQDLLTKKELDEPSMGFHKRVMEKIAPLPAPGGLPGINKNVIGAIAAFFLLSIAALLVMVFYQTNWTNTVTDWKAADLSWNIQFSKPLTYAFLFLDMILGMYLLDEYLRKRWRNHF
jgi:hypothetical protein